MNSLKESITREQYPCSAEYIEESEESKNSQI